MTSEIVTQAVATWMQEHPEGGTPAAYRLDVEVDYEGRNLKLIIDSNPDGLSLFGNIEVVVDGRDTNWRV